MSRYGGFSPSQWILGRYPHRPGNQHQFDEDTFADLGILSETLDASSAFAIQQGLRAEARRQFVKMDVGKRVARAILRKSAPVHDPSTTSNTKSQRQDAEKELATTTKQTTRRCEDY